MQRDTYLPQLQWDNPDRVRQLCSFHLHYCRTAGPSVHNGELGRLLRARGQAHFSLIFIPLPT